MYLVQPGDEARPSESYATWMPYQISAAGIAPAVAAEQPKEEPPVITAVLDLATGDDTGA